MKMNAIKLAGFCLFVVAFAWAAAAQDAPPSPNIAGGWTATIHRPSAQGGSFTEDWTIKQDGAGTAKNGGSDMPMATKLTGLIFRATITDGDMHYVVNASVSTDGTTMDGTLRMGTHEYIVQAKRASK